MNYLDESMRLRKAALAYAEDLKDKGYEGVSVWRYDAPMDNRDPWHKSHQVATGYAVRFTSSSKIDIDVAEGTAASFRNPVPKFHNNSLVIFTGEPLTQAKLIDGGIIADFAGEGAVPMWVAWWSPAEGEHAPPVPTVGLKRFPARESEDDSYPWQIGPRKTWHLIMTLYKGAR